MECIFFIEAYTVLCFGFVLKTVLITRVLTITEQFLHSIKAFLVSQPSLTANRLGMPKKLGVDIARIADPN